MVRCSGWSGTSWTRQEGTQTLGSVGNSRRTLGILYPSGVYVGFAERFLGFVAMATITVARSRLIIAVINKPFCKRSAGDGFPRLEPSSKFRRRRERCC